MAKIFFSYSHVDEALRDRLETHLALLKHQGLIESWHDRRILAGDDFDTAIDANLDTADIILLLVSADFIASRYCYSIEMTRALERHADGTARVIPVILEDCDWHSAPFGKLNAVPKDGKPVTTWPNEAQAWADAARRIRQAIEGSCGSAPAARARPATNAFAPPSTKNPVVGSSFGGPQVSAAAVRSSNLRLKKEFTDFDSDKFLQDGFEYMAKFFDGSLEEIAARNHDIQVRFQRLDAQAFSAIAYRAGKTVAECSVRIGGLSHTRSNMVSFAYNASAPAGTSNEMLHVETDDQSLFFKALGMQFGGGRNEQLSQQGAAEYFWSLFIAKLQ